MKALLLENVHPEAVRILTDRGYEVQTRAGALGEDDLLEALDGVDLLGIRSTTHVTPRWETRTCADPSTCPAECSETRARPRVNGSP